MGGGVGIGCHGGHRIVGDTSRIAMPECGIGLMPDVGGTLMLAQAPGRLGEYLGTTGTRMGPGDAILRGLCRPLTFPRAHWPALKQTHHVPDRRGRCEIASTPRPPGPRQRRSADRTGADRRLLSAGEGLADIREPA
jgi:enoyl-CoA hydratase